MTGGCQGHSSNPYSFALHVSTLDGPTTCTHSKTHYTANTTLPTYPTTTSTNEKVNAPPPLTEGHT